MTGSLRNRLEALERATANPHSMGAIVVFDDVSDRAADEIWAEQNPGKPVPAALVIVRCFSKPSEVGRAD